MYLNQSNRRILEGVENAPREAMMGQIVERNLECSREIARVDMLRQNRMAFNPDGRNPEFVMVKCDCNDQPLDWDQSDDEGESRQVIDPSAACYM